MKRNVTAMHVGIALMLAAGLALPSAAEASIWKKIKKTATKTTSTVSHAVESGAKDAASAVKDTAKKVEEEVPAVGERVHDTGVALGKQVKKDGDKVTYELKKDGQLVGHVVVQGGKVVATETVEAGKVVASEAESGGKYLVDGGKIVGQEVVFNGKVIGKTIIKDGEVVGQAVIEGGEYVVKEGMIVLKEISNLVCKGLISAVRDGKHLGTILPEFSSVSGKLNSRTSSKRTEISGKQNALLTTISNEIKPLEQHVPELKRIAGLMKSNASKMRDLFSSDTLCNSSAKDLESKLLALGLQPNLSGTKSAGLGGFFIREAHAASKEFYMAYNLNGSIAAGGGLQTALSIVTNYKGNTGVFISVGPQIVTNISGGGSVGMQFFPKVDLGDFSGWGWGIGVSGGPPSKIVGAGLDVAFDDSFKKFQGFGISGGVGLGAIPADVGVSGSYAWKLK
ncbi:MAG: hypothetical protein HYS18_07135 [Burkholderiales bacterium]|nr:hypothetical protein [Burkholderiales bacterium]